MSHIKEYMSSYIRMNWQKYEAYKGYSVPIFKRTNETYKAITSTILPHIPSFEHVVEEFFIERAETKGVIVVDKTIYNFSHFERKQMFAHELETEIGLSGIEKIWNDIVNFLKGLFVKYPAYIPTEPYK